MLGPLETWIVVGVFMGIGAVEGLKFNTEAKGNDYKSYLFQLWVDDKVDQYVYMLECKNETTNRRS